MSRLIDNLSLGALLLLSAWSACAAGGANQVPAQGAASDKVVFSNAVDGWDFGMTATELGKLCSQTLRQGRVAFTAIEQDTGPATLHSVYGAYDQMRLALEPIQHIWYLKAVHPEPAVQTAAEQCIGDYNDFMTEIDLSQRFYRRVAAIDLTDASAAEQLMVERRLRDFRQAGVDRDDATRARVRALDERITKLGNRFDRTIREDVRHVDATEEQLHGLPGDFLDSHPANAQGMVSISTDYPDYFPVMTYSADDSLRRELYIADKNIGTPENEKNLKALIEGRHQLATELGYSSYAALAMDGLMMGNPQNARQFLHTVGDAVRQPARRDMAVLLARAQRDEPATDRVQAWQASYLSNLVKQEDYAVDAREVRQYFQFANVQAGIFSLTETLFGVTIVPWHTAIWHEDVTAWEMREGDKVIGRFYLDLHPRAHKYKHAAAWRLRAGLRHGRVPISGLATNFPTGLMEHRQVETFLHEFGHLLHNMFAGEQAWLDLAGMSMEWDFVEAPSQMLQEWVWDYDTLKQFARNASGQTIPRALVARMNRARHFGEAAGSAQQVFYANLSLAYYTRDPGQLALLPLFKELQQQYSPYPYVPGTHFYNSFGHLAGYSSNYYVYQWSLAIAHDLFSRFQANGLHDRATALDYRRKVLAAGGSRPALASIADFLGRPFSPDSYTSYLHQLGTIAAAPAQTDASH